MNIITVNVRELVNGLLYRAPPVIPVWCMSQQGLFNVSYVKVRLKFFKRGLIEK
jgi:hypothetical protein